MCPRCVHWKARGDGMPGDPDERALRRLLAARVAMAGAYYDDGEAQGQEHGISIDFMREPVADIDAKLRALNVARAECMLADENERWKAMMQRAIATCFHEQAHREVMSDPAHFAAEALRAWRSR